MTGLDLARNRHPQRGSDRRDQPDAHEVGDGDRDEVDDRREQRTEVQADGDQDEQQGRALEQRQVIGDDLRLRGARRDRARDADVRVVSDGGPDVALGKPLGRADAPVALDVGRKEQRGQQRGRPLADQRNVADAVGQGVPARLAQRRQLAAVQLRHLDAGGGLVAERQPAGVAGDDDRPAQERKQEELRRALLGFDRLGVGRHEVAQGADLRLLDRRQQQGDRGHRRHDPADDDRHPRGDDDASEAIAHRGQRAPWSRFSRARSAAASSA